MPFPISSQNSKQHLGVTIIYQRIELNFLIVFVTNKLLGEIYDQNKTKPINLQLGCAVEQTWPVCQAVAFRAPLTPNNMVVNIIKCVI